MLQSHPANSAVLARSGQRSRQNNLHVLTLTPFYPSAGDEVSGCFVAELLEQLKREATDSTVVAVDALHHRRKVMDPGKPAHWLRYPQFPGNVGLSSAGVLLHARLQARIRRLHAQQPIDLIHAHAALPCGHAAALLSKQMGIPFVVSVHGLDAFNTCFVQGASVEWRRRASCEVYRQARSVICISEKVRHIVNEGMGDQVSATVIYNGTDPQVFFPDRAAPREEANILIVGNLLRGKGQELVLQAAGKLRRDYPALQFLFIGDGPDRGLFLSLAKHLGIEDRVKFVGRKSRAEVARAMRNCTIFVLPSRYEGLGCVYLEAMASGMPVIGCRGQGIDEIIRHKENGWLIGVSDLDELVQGLSTLLQDADLRVSIGREARRTILDGLTLADQAKQMRTLYASVGA
jgi:glycosyltransferase involved in cell wall biosynthesis